MARKNKSYRRRKTSRNRSRRHRASRRLRAGTAKFTNQEQLGGLQDLKRHIAAMVNEGLLPNVLDGRIFITSKGTQAKNMHLLLDHDIYDIINKLPINTPAKKQINKCSFYCHKNSPPGSPQPHSDRRKPSRKNYKPKCIEQCVQSEIDKTEKAIQKAIQLHTLQKVNAHLGTQIPYEIGRRVADYI
jgi:hypothetical protein